MKKFGPNEPRPCDSGLKYQECCWQKAFTWNRDENGNIHKSIPLQPEIAEMIQKERQEHISKHGRRQSKSTAFGVIEHLNKIDIMKRFTILTCAGLSAF